MNGVVLSGGLFQVFSFIDKYCISYEEIKNHMIKSLSLLNLEPKKILDKYEKITSFDDLSEKSIEKINEKFLEELNTNNKEKILNIFEAKNIEVISLTHLKNFILKFKKFYFNYENLLYLLFDYNIFKLFKIESESLSFSLNINIEQIKQTLNVSYQKFLIFDFDLNRLYKYHILGAFTIYLSCLVNTEYFCDEHKTYCIRLREKNLSVINDKGMFFDFAIFFFIQIINYLKYIENYNTELKDVNGRNLSEKIQNKTGAFNILIIYRYFFKKKEIKRATFFLCDDDLLYTTYVGDYSKNCYDYLEKYYLKDEKNRISAVIAKLSSNFILSNYYQLLKDFSKIQQKYQDVFYCNNAENSEMFSVRQKMVEYMKKYLTIKKFPKIKLPLSFIIEYSKSDTYEKFNKFLEKNNIHYPLMLKFSSTIEKYEHYMFNIVCGEGLKNFIKFLNEFVGNDDKKEIKIIIQQFINHGGFYIKLYRIEKKSYCFFRPSIPDPKEEYINKFEEYKNGYLKLQTQNLVSKEYKNFWKKVNGDNEIYLYKDKIDQNLINNLGENFENYSKDSLVGLDLLYDYKKDEYYLFDINQFPGYKELNDNFDKIIKNHLLIGLKKAKK